MEYKIYSRENGELLGESDEAFIDDFFIIGTEEEALVEAKKIKLAEIKNKTEEEINNLQWRVERAQEREAIGAEGETVGQILAIKESWRRASNRSEEEIKRLNNIAEVLQYPFQLQDADIFRCRKITKLAFLNLFTEQERIKIYEARNKYKNLDDFLILFETAKDIDLNNNDIKVGITLLETAGFIQKGRAREILEG